MTENMAVIALDNNARRERISSLLLRYPEILESEIDELIDFYKTVPPVETALLTCDEDVAAKAAQFVSDHAKAVSRGLEAPLVLAVFILVAVVIMFSMAFHLSA